MILLKDMLKEETRLHTSIVGAFLFFLLPFCIFMIVFAVTRFAPVIELMGAGALAGLIIHLTFAFFGMNVGAFGLYGKEFMNRRFGHASLISYSSRTLPVSDRTIFTNVIIKDIIYYFIMFILPSVFGIIAAARHLGLPFSGIRLLISLSLSFLFGLAIVFFLSTLYAHSAKLLVAFLTASVIIFIALKGYAWPLTSMFPPYAYYVYGSHLLASAITILVLSTISIVFFRISYSEKLTRFENYISMVPPGLLLMARDYLDLKRSRGGFGRIIFSIIIPMGMLWLFITFFVRYVPLVDFIIVFSIFLGLYTSSIYSWLSEYDSYANYAFLPVKVAEIIHNKVKSTLVLSIVSVFVFILAAIYDHTNLLNVIIGLLSYVSMFFWGLSATVYLTGLSPNAYFFDSRNIIMYLLYIVPPAILFLVISATFPYALFASPLLVPVSILMIGAAEKKWSREEIRSF